MNATDEKTVRKLVDSKATSMRVATLAVAVQLTLFSTNCSANGRHDFQWNVEVDPLLYASAPALAIVAAVEPRPLKLKAPDGPVVRAGRYDVRTYTLSIRDSFEKQHGGMNTVVSIHKEFVEFAGLPWSGPWPARMGDEHPVGNRELLKVTAIDANRGTVTVQLRSKTRLSILDAYSF